MVEEPSEWFENLRNGFGAVLINHCKSSIDEIRKVIEGRKNYV